MTDHECQGWLGDKLMKKDSLTGLTTVTGWCFSTTTELMGGETPMIAKLLLILVLEAKSHRPVIRAVIVFPAFCCAEVTTLGMYCKTKPNKHQVAGRPTAHFALLCWVTFKENTQPLNLTRQKGNTKPQRSQTLQYSSNLGMSTTEKCFGDLKPFFWSDRVPGSVLVCSLRFLQGSSLTWSKAHRHQHTGSARGLCTHLCHFTTRRLRTTGTEPQCGYSIKHTPLAHFPSPTHPP